MLLLHWSTLVILVKDEPALYVGYHTRLIHSTAKAIRSPCHTTYWPYWEKKTLVIISFTGKKNSRKQLIALG